MYFPRSVSACNFCTEINLFVCAFFRVFSLNFEGDKLSPWPFFKGTIPTGSNPGFNYLFVNAKTLTDLSPYFKDVIQYYYCQFSMVSA